MTSRKIRKKSFIKTFNEDVLIRPDETKLNITNYNERILYISQIIPSR